MGAQQSQQQTPQIQHQGQGGPGQLHQNQNQQYMMMPHQQSMHPQGHPGMRRVNIIDFSDALADWDAV